MIEVKDHRIRAGGKKYSPGDIITGLDQEEETRLIEEGYAKCVPSSGVSESKKEPQEKGTGSPVLKEKSEEGNSGPDTSYPVDSQGSTEEEQKPKRKSPRGKPFQKKATKVKNNE